MQTIQNTSEEWRAVKGFEDSYAVSSMGRVKSIERIVTYKDGRKRLQKEQILKPTKDNSGYLIVSLYKNGVGKHHLVHRLVALTFIPNPDPEKYDIVNHKIEGDEGRLINTVENLEWCDYEYNNNYGTHNERMAKAKSKTVYQYTLAGELVKEWQSVSEVQRQMGWFRNNISACCLGKLKTAYGYRWSYSKM